MIDDDDHTIRAYGDYNDDNNEIHNNPKKKRQLPKE
jgi:hypothetical protein